LYLATTYISQYIPGATKPDNQRFAEQAIEPYQFAQLQPVSRFKN
jgi:hypothetical protein